MGKSGPDTSGQNEAARMNAEIAKEVWENYKSTYLPMEKSYVAEAQNYDNPEHREQAAQKASGDVEQAFAQTKAARAREMEGMGIRPDDAKFQAINSRLMRDKVAMQAGAQNMARQSVEQEGWNRKTGALSLGKGLPAQASNAAANAGQGFANANKQEYANDRAMSEDVGNLVGGFAGMFADGGYVNVGHIRRLAMGGPAGLDKIIGNQSRIPSAPSGGSQSSGIARGIKTGRAISKIGNGIYNKFINPAQFAQSGVGETMDVAGLDAAQAASEGITAGIGDAGAMDAAGSVGAGLGTAGDAAAAAAADTAATAGTAAATDAAATAGVAGGAEAATAGMAAMGPLGWAALAALGIFAATRADGGPINGEAGGDVRGPGTETSDSIPAMLSDGEYVLNADAVKHFGMDRLEKMNQVGLNKRYGIKR